MDNTRSTLGCQRGAYRLLHLLVDRPESDHSRVCRVYVAQIQRDDSGVYLAPRTCIALGVYRLLAVCVSVTFWRIG